MLPSIAPAKSPSGRSMSTGQYDRPVLHDKSSTAGSPSAIHPLHTFPADNPSSPAITAVLKTPAVSANFSVFASPERRQRFDVQALLNEIHSRPSMAGLLGTGIVSALSAKSLSETQTSKPLEVRANLDRFIRSKLQDVCTVKDDIIQSLGQKLEVMTAEAARLERALSEESAASKRKVAELEVQLHEAVLASRMNVDDEGLDMSPHHLRTVNQHESFSSMSGSGSLPTWNSSEGDKDTLFAYLGLASRARSSEVDIFGHAQGSCLAPQLGVVAPIIATTMEQVYRSRRPQRPTDASIIISHNGDINECNEVETQRQSLRRRMAKPSKTSDAIECSAKSLLNIIAFEDVSHGGGCIQPRRTGLSVPSATGAMATAAVSSNLGARRKSTFDGQPGKGTTSISGADEPLPIDLFLEQQQRTDFISNATAAISMLPTNLTQDFIAELLRQVSCFGAALAIAAEAIAILSIGDDSSSLCVQAALSLQRVCRVQRVQLYEIQWDSRSIVPIIDGKPRERDDLGISQRIPIGQGYAGKCVHMGPQIVNFPASLGQDFQPSDRGEGSVASTVLALPIGLPGQPPVMVATLINKLLPLGAPSQTQLDSLQKGKSDTMPFGSLPKHRHPPPNADKPPFSEADVSISMAVAVFIAHKAMRCRLSCSLARLQSGMMARACAMGGAGVGGESVLSCVRSQELCAAMLSDVRSAANWSCIDLMLVLPGPPLPLGKFLFGKCNLIVHVARDDVFTSSSTIPTTIATRMIVKPVSEASMSQLQAQLATQWLPQTFRRPATLETKSLLQTPSQLLNQIVCVSAAEQVIPTEVGTDYAIIKNPDLPDSGTVSQGIAKAMPLTGVEEIVRYYSTETARGVAQCSVQGQTILSSLEDPGSGIWTITYADKNHNPNTHIFSRMEPSSSIAAAARPFSSGASNGRYSIYIPVIGAGGNAIAIVRAEKNVQSQRGESEGSQFSVFSEDEILALDCVGRHCGSILQATCLKLNEIAKKTLQGLLAPDFTPSKRVSVSTSADISGTSNVITPAWCVRAFSDKQRQHMDELCSKACISLQCHKKTMHASTIALSQFDTATVYEGFKHNGIAQSAINSGECVVVHNVKAHAGYDSRLDALASIQGSNCLAAPIVFGDSKANSRCVGVLFATNKTQGGFLGPDVVIASAFADAAAGTLSGLLERMPQLRSLVESKPTPAKRSEGDEVDVVEMRSILNTLQNL